MWIHQTLVCLNIYNVKCAFIFYKNFFFKCVLFLICAADCSLPFQNEWQGKCRAGVSVCFQVGLFVWFPQLHVCCYAEHLDRETHFVIIFFFFFFFWMWIEWTVVFTAVHYDDHYMISVLQNARSGTGTITDFVVSSVNKRKKTKRVIGF